MKHAYGRFVASCLLLVSPITYSEALEVVAGSYAIESQMVLPHMEEMRRTSKRVQVCIDDGNAAGMFPIFNHPALRGCALLTQRIDPETIDFVLNCAGVNGARGTAQLTFIGDNIKGELNVKVGGKNMTFVQYVNARRSGACENSPAE